MAIYNLGGGGGQPELQTKTATPLITNAQQIIVPDDGYDGLSQVTVNPMPAGALKTPTVNSIGYVSSGVQTAGFLDTSATAGLQLSTQAAKTITPTTYSQTAVAKGKYTTGDIIVQGDSNLISSNINPYREIYGVQGTSNGSYWTYTMTALADEDGTLIFDNGGYLCYNKALIMSVVIYYSNSTGDLAYVDWASAIQTVVGMSSYGIPMASQQYFDKAMFFYGGTSSNPYYHPYIIENNLLVEYDSSKFRFGTSTGANFRQGAYYTAIVRTILTQP